MTRPARLVLAMPPQSIAALRPPRYLTQDELRRFFTVIHSPRDRTLFALMYHHGLRVGEVALLSRGDVSVSRNRIVVRRLKGGRWGEQPLFPQTVELLQVHLDLLGEAAPEAPLFPGRCGPLRKRQIQALFVRYREAAGLPEHLTCHSLRHSIATHLLDAGVALEVIQEHLGHQSIRSTSIYARLTDRRRAEVFRQLESSPWIVHPSASPPRTAAAEAA